MILIFIHAVVCISSLLLLLHENEKGKATEKCINAISFNDSKYFGTTRLSSPKVLIQSYFQLKL